MNPTVVQSVLGGVILAAILWLARSVGQYGNQLTRVETILTGADGQNGLNGEVKALRRRTHEHGDELHVLKGKQELLTQRVSVLEQST